MAGTIYGLPSDGSFPEHMGAALDDAYGHTVSYAGAIPAGLGWDSGLGLAPMITTHRDGYVVGDVGVTPKELFAQFSTAQSAPVNSFYAAPNGVDTAAGTYDAPFRSIRKCIESANTAGQPARIVVAAGDYLGANGFDGLSPTVDTAFIAAGGVVNVSTALPASGMNFSTHGVETNTYYIVTPAVGVSRVLDLTQIDAHGNYVELKKVDGSGIANAHPGTYREGAELYINREDGKQPTAQNTRILTTRPNFVLTSQVNVYVGTEDGSPWVIEGSPNVQAGADPGSVFVHLDAPTADEKAFVMEGARINFAGEPTAGANSVTVNRWNGVAAFFNVHGGSPTKDAFNAHNNGHLAARSLFLTVNCSAVDVGRLSPSANGLTLHENVIGIDVAGDYSFARGGTVHDIGQSKHYLFGTRTGRDFGDVVSVGGTIWPAAFLIRETAEAWAEQVVVRAGAGSYAYRTVGTGAKIHRRDCPPVPQPDAGDGVFDTY